MKKILSLIFLISIMSCSNTDHENYERRINNLESEISDLENEVSYLQSQVWELEDNSHSHY
jgi:peptidoglycan hydrolase CwlO-like protein